jgi:predicted dehydrogenase
LQVLSTGGDRKWDQLTSELRHFVDAVRNQTIPRVTGEDGRDALALAERILDSLRSHAWNNDPAGPMGPNDMPKPLGNLFEMEQHEAA